MTESTTETTEQKKAKAKAANAANAKANNEKKEITDPKNTESTTESFTLITLKYHEDLIYGKKVKRFSGDEITGLSKEHCQSLVDDGLAIVQLDEQDLAK